VVTALPGTGVVTPLVSRCHACGQPVIGCRDVLGRIVRVDPIPIPGGELIINGGQGAVLRTLTFRELHAARRRGELGFTRHDVVCRRVGGAM
jgi:hypothetical protein